MKENDESNIAKKEVSQKLLHIFFFTFKSGVIVLGISFVVALLIPLCFTDSGEKVVVAKLTFSSLGILFGILQVVIGVLLSILGLTLDYDIDTSAGPVKLKLVSASPGILLLVIGNMLFAFSLTEDFSISTSKKEDSIMIDTNY